MTTIERFLAKVDKSSGCWLWTARRDRHGYGFFTIDRKSVRAHRLAYALFVGELTPGLEIDHMCHNRDRTCLGGPGCIHRRCVNPEHLELVTHRENGLRGRSPMAINAAKTHCSAGHPFNEVNTYRNAAGYRQCRRCNALAVARYQSRKKVSA